MLQEVKHVRQIPGEPFRRWFTDNMFDLIVWHDPDHHVTGFQLCYREDADHKALTWQRDSGFTHKRVDDGEGRPFRPKMTPILVPDGVFERDHVLTLFENESKEIDPDVVSIVTRIIKKYPSSHDEG